jgi:hypothetical protein
VHTPTCAGPDAGTGTPDAPAGRPDAAVNQPSRGGSSGGCSYGGPRGSGFTLSLVAAAMALALARPQRRRGCASPRR